MVQNRNWMEAFINRWLWLMSLNDIRKLKESIQKQSILVSTSNNLSSTGNTSSTAITTLSSMQSQSRTQQSNLNSNSPSELPPPSPASSIGSSAGSVNGSSNNANNHTINSSQSSSIDTIGASSSHSQQQNQFEMMQKLLNLQERYIRFNDYVVRSQNFWDLSEQLINESDYLNG